MAGSPQDVHLLVPLTLRRKGTMGDIITDDSLHHLHLLSRLVLFMHSWISEEVLCLIDLYLICCRVTIFSQGVTLHHSIISGIFIKATSVHHAIIQKKMDELLAKGATEPSCGRAGFYFTPTYLLFLNIWMAYIPS